MHKTLSLVSLMVLAAVALAGCATDPQHAIAGFPINDCQDFKTDSGRDVLEWKSSLSQSANSNAGASARYHLHDRDDIVRHGAVVSADAPNKLCHLQAGDTCSWEGTFDSNGGSNKAHIAYFGFTNVPGEDDQVRFQDQETRNVPIRAWAEDRSGTLWLSARDTVVQLRADDLKNPLAERVDHWCDASATGIWEAWK